MSRKHFWRIVHIPAEQMGSPDAQETEFAGKVEDIEYNERDGKGLLYFSIQRDEIFYPLLETLRAYRDDVLMGEFVCVQCDHARREMLTCREVPEYWERMGWRMEDPMILEREP